MPVTGTGTDLFFSQEKKTLPPVTGTGTLECRLSPTGTGTGDFGKVPVIGTGDKFVEVPVPVTGTGDFEMVPVTGTGGHIPAPAPAATF